MATKIPPDDTYQLPVAPTPPARSWNFGAIVWGLLFISGGSLFLLKTANIINLNYSALWSLWPLLIVTLGLSIIPVRGRLAALGASTVALGMISIVILSLLGIIGPAEPKIAVQNAEIALMGQSVDKIRVSVKTGASNVTLQSNSGNGVMRAQLTSTFARLDKSSKIEGSTQIVQLTADGNGQPWTGDYKNDFTVSLAPSIPIDLFLDTGAVSVKGDLSTIQLSSLRIDSGVSDINFKLGTKSDKTDIHFNIGVSSIKFMLPKSSGVSLRLENGLSSKKIPGLQEISKDNFESSNYSSATHKINIDGKMGMADLEIQYY